MENLTLNRPLATLSVADFLELIEQHSGKLLDSIDLQECCKLTGYTEKSLRTFVFNGTVPHFKSRGRLRFSRKEILEWLNEK
jgi:predicted DNA-binding transcriptional regulator AlpA